MSARGTTMSKASNKKSDLDLLNEYDFSKGVRGKYAGRYVEDSNVVVLPPDLAQAFPTAEAVHDALRDVLMRTEKARKNAPRKRPA